jgi:hypothetical protein
VLFTAGLLGLLEQEIVRVLLHINPSTIISGICFAFVLLGAGFTLGRNFRIGPVEVELRDQEDQEATDLRSDQRTRSETETTALRGRQRKRRDDASKDSK